MTTLREHPNAVLVRERFAALNAGDVAPFYDAVREDFHNVNDIGAGPWHENHGRDAFFGFFADFAGLFDDEPFGQEVLDVLGWDDRVLTIVRETGVAQGQRFDNRALYVLGVDPDGRYTSLYTTDMDQETIRRFWAGVALPASAPAWDGAAVV
ncbi:nuclear transport factor 2 family protein [Pseudonocardia endophytica]|uniref:SnoaL-like protein n=1 Tax=Pseudonocardia endophytica TaxID=401976 RepID=A0A4R1HKU7_PSEEN|nr:nuclear transport factor 2 family protein [Pseudonocardia endophytica]TCK23017.1 SnoaL-like protein [Pseudonocardia endophytica]